MECGNYYSPDSGLIGTRWHGIRFENARHRKELTQANTLYVKVRITSYISTTVTTCCNPIAVGWCTKTKYNLHSPFFYSRSFRGDLNYVNKRTITNHWPFTLLEPTKGYCLSFAPENRAAHRVASSIILFFKIVSLK